MGCSAILVNVLFANNIAERGSALVSDGSSSPYLLYVTIVSNTASDIGASLYQGTYGAEGQTAGNTSQSNDPKIMYSLVMGNTSAASGTSISNWHDCDLNVDGNSVVETIDGFYSLTDYFNDAGNNDFEPVAPYASLGWSATRDTSNWETAITSLASRTYGTFPYDTSNTTGSTTTIKVDSTASGDNNGTSWANAYTDLQNALSNAGNGDSIWVAQGTYYPASAGNRTTSFVLKEGVKVYGGFDGSESNLEERDFKTNATILSGDIDGDNLTGDNPDADNSCHVVVGAKGSTLDGFTIQHGYADGEWFHQRGGGILIYGSSTEANNPTISNCTFQNNYAVEGGAMANYNYGTPTITDCAFSNNQAARGGAALFRTGSAATVTGSSFSNNEATDRGGAVFIDYGASPNFSSSCSFTSNTSVGYGGAVYIDDNASQIHETNPTFDSCTFTMNSTSAFYGGAVFAYNTVTDVEISNSGFTGNTSTTDGGAIGFRYLVTATLSGNTYNDASDTVYYDDTCSVTGAP